jgi:hypothetical protein
MCEVPSSTSPTGSLQREKLEVSHASISSRLLFRFIPSTMGIYPSRRFQIAAGVEVHETLCEEDVSKGCGVLKCGRYCGSEV